MDFELKDIELQECLEKFMELPPNKRLFLTHYELATTTEINDSNLWKRFLTDPKVVDWIQTELTLFNQAQQRKLFKNATTDYRSTGAAQMITALGKSLEHSTIKDGPVFIYSYVPLNDKEEAAVGVRKEEHDIFMRGELE